uniref:Uncharacterized protein MANES_03G074200 n=1 Tax=Rhizophora mucronata TaxID=61149 RepID=A0A2P2JRM2_RHIMU
MTTLAPTAFIFSIICSASSFDIPFFNIDGVFSTKSFASLRPKSVKLLTSLITLIFVAASYDSSFSSKTVFSGFFSSLTAAVGAFIAIAAKPAAPGFITPTVGSSFILIFLIKIGPNSANSAIVSPAISSTSLKTRPVGGPRCSVGSKVAGS